MRRYVVGDRRHRLAPPQFGPQAFGQQPRHQPEQGEPIAGQHEEDGSPSEMHQELAADERRHDRSDPHHEDQHRQHPHRLAPVEVVAHDGPRHHQRRTAAERLEEAEDDELRDVGCEGAAKRRADEDREPDIERRLASQSVGQRTVEGLTERDADEVAGQAHLHRGNGHAKLARDLRERRQIHVDGQRPDRGEGAQDHREAMAVVVSVGPGAGHALRW